MTKKIYILVGASGSGKTWVANQIRDKYTYVPHDTYGMKGNNDYLMAISAHAQASEKPVICDTPFSLSQLQGPLSEKGFEVKPVFVVEKPSVTRQRYELRYQNEKKGQAVMPEGHLSRIDTYKKRAKELNAPVGTSAEILAYMRDHDSYQKSAAAQRPEPRLQHEAHDAKRNNERDQEAQRAPIQDPPAETIRDVRGWSI